MWCIFSLLTALHIYANVQCMKLLELNSFNTLRMDIVLSNYFSQLDQLGILDDTSQSIDNCTRVSVLLPSEVAKIEPLFFLPRRTKTLSSNVLFGISFNNLVQSCASLATNLRSFYDQDKAYIVKVSRKRAKRKGVYVSLHSNASSVDKTKANFHALLLAYLLEKYAPADDEKILELEKKLDFLIDPLFSLFSKECQRGGWDLSKTGVYSRGYGFTCCTITREVL